jgi:1,4-dihydroxy-2-naphthoate octaprenyltransferase
MKHWIEAARLRTYLIGFWNNLEYVCFGNPTDILTPTEVFNWRLFGFAI